MGDLKQRGAKSCHKHKQNSHHCRRSSACAEGPHLQREPDGHEPLHLHTARAQVRAQSWQSPDTVRAQSGQKVTGHSRSTGQDTVTAKSRHSQGTGHSRSTGQDTVTAKSRHSQGTVRSNDAVRAQDTAGAQVRTQSRQIPDTVRVQSGQMTQSGHSQVTVTTKSRHDQGTAHIQGTIRSRDAVRV